MNRFATRSVKKRGHPVLRAAMLPVLVGALLLAFLAFGVSSVSRTAQTERLKSTRDAIARAAAHAYASQGSYPASLEELERVYGLQLDHENYIIDYQAIGQNIMPQVTVLPKDAF